MRFGQQEDAHEFLRYAIDAMQKSCLSGCTRYMGPLSDGLSLFFSAVLSLVPCPAEGTVGSACSPGSTCIPGPLSREAALPPQCAAPSSSQEFVLRTRGWAQGGRAGTV